MDHHLWAGQRSAGGESVIGAVEVAAAVMQSSSSMNRSRPGAEQAGQTTAEPEGRRSRRSNCSGMTRRCSAIFWMALTVLPAVPLAAQQPQPVPPKIKTFLEKCERSRRGAIVELEQSLRGLRSGQLKAKDMAGRVKRIEADLARLEAKKTLIVPTFIFPP